MDRRVQGMGACGPWIALGLTLFTVLGTAGTAQADAWGSSQGAPLDMADGWLPKLKAPAALSAVAPGRLASLGDRQAALAGRRHDWMDPERINRELGPDGAGREFGFPLALSYMVGPAFLALGTYYAEDLNLDDLSTGTQVALAVPPFLLPSLVHLGYDDPAGALVALGGAAYMASLGAVTGGLAGYLWAAREDVDEQAWDASSTRWGAVAGAAVGYALWAIIDVVAFSKSPPKKKKRNEAPGLGASVSPLVGPTRESRVGVSGMRMAVHGAW